MFAKPYVHQRKAYQNEQVSMLGQTQYTMIEFWSLLGIVRTREKVNDQVENNITFCNRMSELRWVRQRKLRGH